MPVLTLNLSGNLFLPRMLRSNEKKKKKSLLNSNTWSPQGMLLTYKEVTEVMQLKGADPLPLFKSKN